MATESKTTPKPTSEICLTNDSDVIKRITDIASLPPERLVDLVKKTVLRDFSPTYCQQQPFEATFRIDNSISEIVSSIDPQAMKIDIDGCTAAMAMLPPENLIDLTRATKFDGITPEKHLRDLNLFNSVFQRSLSEVANHIADKNPRAAVSPLRGIIAATVIAARASSI